MNNDDDNDYYELPEEEENELVHQYEAAVARKRLDYFDVDEMEIIIEHYLYAGDIDKAQQALKYGFRLHPNDSNLYCQKAAILLTIGKLDEALALIERYRDVNDPVHTYNRAEILYKIGRTREALDEFRHMVDNDDNDVVELKGLCGDIITLLNNYQDYTHSLYFIDKGLAINPNDLDFLEIKGLTLECMDNHRQAIDLYNRVLDLDPYRISTWHYLGALYLDSENYADALKAFDYVLAIAPNNAIALSQKAYCLFYQNDYAKAAEYCRQYLQIYPDDDVLLMLLGECYNNLGDTDRALKVFRKAVALNPDAPEGHIAIGEILDQQGKYNAAIDELRQAVRLNPDNALTLQKLGNMYFTQADFSAAATAYGRAYRLDAHLEKICLCYALAFYGLGDFEQAQKYYNKAKHSDKQAAVVFLQIFPEAATKLTL